MTKKLTGFIILWVVFFSILWGLDENGLFSYRTIEIFFGEELALPQEYSTAKVNVAELGQRKRKKTEIEEDFSTRRETNKKQQQVTQKKSSKKIPQTVQKHQPAQKKQSSPVLDEVVPLYKRGDFYTCLHKIKQHKQNSFELKNLKRKCTRLILLIEDLSQKASFHGKITIIKMSNGKEYIGKIVANGIENIDFQSEWGTFPLPKSRIANKTTLDSEQFRKQLSKKFKQQIRTLSPKNHRQIVLFIEDVYKNNLPHLIAQAVERLERKNIDILKDLIEYKASKIYRSYLWCETMGQKQRSQKFRNRILDKYPSSQAAREIKEQSLQEIAPPARVQRETVKRLPKVAGAASEKTKKANKYYGVAFRHLKKSFPGEPNADRELAKAKENFQKACKYYQEALSLQPNNTNLQKQLQQSMEYYHHCIKQTRLE